MSTANPDWSACRASVSSPSGPIRRAADVLGYGIDSVESLFGWFEKSRTERGATGGYTTHAEQDLLRSMIVFAAATLDSVIKQLLRDCLSSATKSNRDARGEFERFVDRRLRAGAGEASINISLLRAALLSDSTSAFLVDEYVSELTGSSLQSRDEVARAAAALGLDLRLTMAEAKQLQEVFCARNEIVHELDYLHRKKKLKLRNRRNRNRQQCVDQALHLLALSKRFVEETDAVL